MDLLKTLTKLRAERVKVLQGIARLEQGATSIKYRGSLRPAHITQPKMNTSADPSTGSEVVHLRRLRFRLRELNSAITSLEGLERIRKRPSSRRFTVMALASNRRLD